MLDNPEIESLGSGCRVCCVNAVCGSGGGDIWVKLKYDTSTAKHRVPVLCRKEDADGMVVL